MIGTVRKCKLRVCRDVSSEQMLNDIFLSLSPGAAEGERKPVLLEDVTATAAFINAAEVVVIGFFQVC